jgi:hypothetical protein
VTALLRTWSTLYEEEEEEEEEEETAPKIAAPD